MGWYDKLRPQSRGPQQKLRENLRRFSEGMDLATSGRKPPTIAVDASGKIVGGEEHLPAMFPEPGPDPQSAPSPFTTDSSGRLVFTGDPKDPRYSEAHQRRLDDINAAFRGSYDEGRRFSQERQMSSQMPRARALNAPSALPMPAVRAPVDSDANTHTRESRLRQLGMASNDITADANRRYQAATILGMVPEVISGSIGLPPPSVPPMMVFEEDDLRTRKKR